MGNHVEQNGLSQHQYFSLFQAVRKNSRDILLTRRPLSHPSIRQHWELSLTAMRQIPS